MEQHVLALRKGELVVPIRRLAVMKQRRDDSDVLGKIRERKMRRREQRQHRGDRDDPELKPIQRSVLSNGDGGA